MTTPAPAGPPSQDGPDTAADPESAPASQAPAGPGDAAGPDAARDDYEPV